MDYTYETIAKMIDHSLLHPALTDREMEEGCDLAGRYQVASVCIKPYYVARAAERLHGTGVAVGAVVGFPHGGSVTRVKRFETEIACADGATEIDMVINIGKALSRDWSYVASDVEAVVREAHAHGALVKVIFENDFLTDDAIKQELCRICAGENADFVKTSTGYGFVKRADGNYSYQGATDHDLALMRECCPPHMQIKAAGGIRDLDALLRVRALGVTRVGATATAAILDEVRRRLGSESV